jgi:hypothetical protein
MPETTSTTVSTTPRPLVANLGRARLGSGLFAMALLLSIGVSAFDVYALAIHTPQNSDAVQSFLEAPSVLDGDVLLSGWHLTNDNFIFTDLPFFVAARWLFGAWPGSLAVVPAFIYVLIIGASLAASLSSLRLSRRNVIALTTIILLIGLPAAGAYLPMLLADHHAASILFSLVAFLLLAALARTEHIRERPLAVLALVVMTYAAAASDLFTLFFAFVPALIVLVTDFLLLPRRSAAGLTAIVAVSCILGGLTPLAIAHLGGFTTEPTLKFAVVTPEQLGRTIPGFFFGLLDSAGADIFGKDFGKTGLIAGTVANAARLMGWILGSVAVFRNLLLVRHRDNISLLDWLLILSIATLAATCVLSRMFDIALSGDNDPFAGDAAKRYLSPIVMFGAILAARAIPGMVASLPTKELRVFVSGALIMLTGGLAIGHSARMARLMASPPWTAANPFVTVASWLESRQLNSGVGEYWESSIITALTKGKVTVRAILAPPEGRLAPYLWLASEQWYLGTGTPMFVIWRDGETPRQNVNAKTVAATYGAPKRIARVGEFEIAILHEPQR